MPLPPPEKFRGTGVYALYYIGKNPLYSQCATLNRLAYTSALYVGKAVPKGWRQSRISDAPMNQSYELFRRLGEHSRNIAVTADLAPSDFMCRFVIFEATGSDMIGTIEAALIKLYRPVWNSAVDGFGNHDPGSGRYEQARSDWDVLHPGRKWALKCNGTPKERTAVLADVTKHLSNL
jgi:hypothetical protein